MAATAPRTPAVWTLAPRAAALEVLAAEEAALLYCQYLYEGSFESFLPVQSLFLAHLQPNQLSLAKPVYANWRGACTLPHP
jgi:hypothetical protein